MLSFLSLIFISKNIYYGYVENSPAPEIELKVEPGANEKVIWERLSGYLILSIVLLIIFIFMRRFNDGKLEERLIKEDEVESDSKTKV